MKNNFVICSLCLFSLLTTGCTKDDINGTDSGSIEINDTYSSVAGINSTSIDNVLVESEMGLNSEIEYNDPLEEINPDDEDYVENSSFSEVVSITFSPSSAASISSLPEGVTAQISGNDVTITSTISSVEYILSGSTSNGMFKLYSEKKFKLTLKAVSIVNIDGPAINIQSSKRAFVVIAGGTDNYLEDGSEYAVAPNDEDQKGCLFSEGKLLFSSDTAGGSLKIKANYKHGIVCDDYILFRKGNKIEVISASKDGIHANDEITIRGGSLTITSNGDAIECEDGGIIISGGVTNLKTLNESSHGLKSVGTVEMTAGAVKITTNGNASKGISSDSDISITGGKIITICKGDAIYDASDNDTSSPAGIKCDGDLTINGATFIAYADGKGGKGINVEGNATFGNSDITILTNGKKYIYSSSMDSSPKGVKVEGDLTINSGNIIIQTTGGEGSEALESKSSISINGGMVNIVAYDDCINAANSIFINGGTIYCYSSNNDGIDSNGTISISGGLVIASGTQVPEEGIDCDQNNFAITGGTLISFGGATSYPTSSSCTHNSLVYSGSASANSIFNISSESGENLITCIVPRQYQQMTVLFSCPLLAQSSKYRISTGGAVSNSTQFHSLYTSGTYSGGTVATSFTQSSRVTNIGGGNFPGGNFPGGRPGGF